MMTLSKHTDPKPPFNPYLIIEFSKIIDLAKNQVIDQNMQNFNDRDFAILTFLHFVE